MSDEVPSPTDAENSLKSILSPEETNRKEEDNSPLPFIEDTARDSSHSVTVNVTTTVINATEPSKVVLENGSINFFNNAWTVTILGGVISGVIAGVILFYLLNGQTNPEAPFVAQTATAVAVYATQTNDAYTDTPTPTITLTPSTTPNFTETAIVEATQSEATRIRQLTLNAPTNTSTPTITPLPLTFTPSVTSSPTQTATSDSNSILLTKYALTATAVALTPLPTITFSPTPSPSPADIAESYVSIISANNLREGPGQNYNVIGEATLGERYKVIGQNQGDGMTWYKIAHPDSTNKPEAWIAEGQRIRLELGSDLIPFITSNALVVTSIPPVISSAIGNKECGSEEVEVWFDVTIKLEFPVSNITGFKFQYLNDSPQIRNNFILNQDGSYYISDALTCAKDSDNGRCTFNVWVRTSTNANWVPDIGAVGENKCH